MKGTVALWLLLVSGVPGLGQTPDNILQNNGKPMRVASQCSETEIADLGLSCTVQEPCPIFLELSSFEAVGNKLFLAGNLHSATATLSSILLSSTDGGKTWVEPHPRIRYAGLEQIQFIDFETGWVGGEVLLSLPRDAFFLTTTDGGTTWRQRAIFEEGRVGAVEHFFFDSRSSGTLLIDRRGSGESGMRHERYDSMTGGDSWTLSQVSANPIPLKRAKAAGGNADWRLRADGQSKSHRLDKRSGEHWQTVASFLVHAGECKVEERVAPEAPPEDVQKAPAPSPGIFRLPPEPSKRRKPGL